MTEIIRVDHITKRFPAQKKKPAIQDVSLQVEEGTLFGLVGPDGAGKTTLLRILSTVLPASSGSGSIAGADLRKQAETIRKMIGYMPQDFSQYPDLSLRENLNFFADIQHVPNTIKKERIERMLEFTHLKEFESRRAAKLSGGMKKKLALASAMVHNPKLLILDEPSTGVDPVSRRELWALLAEVVRDGVTVIVSTPYMDEAERCNSIAMLYEGEVLTQGTPDQIISALPAQMLEVKAKPRKVIRQIISEAPYIQDWNPVGDTLRLTLPLTYNLEDAIADLNDRFVKENLNVSFLRKSRRTMEDAFVHLVREERQAND